MFGSFGRFGVYFEAKNGALGTSFTNRNINFQEIGPSLAISENLR
jgi:hypothetical protein